MEDNESMNKSSREKDSQMKIERMKGKDSTRSGMSVTKAWNDIFKKDCGRDRTRDQPSRLFPG
jgi:hypothetical protein